MEKERVNFMFVCKLVIFVLVFVSQSGMSGLGFNNFSGIVNLRGVLFFEGKVSGIEKFFFLLVVLI